RALFSRHSRPACFERRRGRAKLSEIRRTFRLQNQSQFEWVLLSEVRAGWTRYLRFHEIRMAASELFWIFAGRALDRIERVHRDVAHPSSGTERSASLFRERPANACARSLLECRSWRESVRAG